MTDTAHAASSLPPPFAAATGQALWQRLAGRAGLAGKAALVGGLALALLIPLGLVQGIIAERSAAQRAATEDIRSLWGGPQQIAGPVLRIPYRTQETGSSQLLWVLPETLTVTSRLVPELRHRGLYQTVVYRAEIEIAGSFAPLQRSVLSGRPKRVDWREARLTLGIADPRSLLLAEPAQLAGHALAFEPSADPARTIFTLAAALPALASSDPEVAMPFRLRLRLNGSGDLALLPLARNSEVRIEAAWDAPSFFGRFAAEQRRIDAEGFHATWRIAHLGTGLPQLYDSFDGQVPDIRRFEANRFGVTLMQPIGAHRESERAAKYGLLFISLTLGVWLLFELIAGVRVHVLHYALVGAALCVFYLLLLSLAERLGFAAAYGASAAAVLLQTTAFTLTITCRPRLALLFAAAIAGLYGYLYVLLQLEEHSLIGGSLLLFAVLSLAMWGTRRLARQAPG